MTANTLHSSKWLHRYAKLLTGVTFLLIIAGGLVTSTHSGLSVPDWPLSYGQWMPPMVGGIFYEHSHRMIAASVGVMTLVLTLWVGFTEQKKWLRWMVIGALGTVVLQGILGGLTVLFLLPAPISIIHACLAQTFFTLVVSIAYLTNPALGEDFTLQEKRESSQSIFEPLKKLLFMTAGLTYAQLILGAALRHTENRLIIIPHVLSAFLILIHVIFILVYVFRNLAPRPSNFDEYAALCRLKWTTRHFNLNEALEQNRTFFLGSIILGVISVFQIALGMGSFVFTRMLSEAVQPTILKVLFVTAHQTLGALLLGTTVFLLLHARQIGRVS